MEPVGRFNDRANKNELKMPGTGPKATDPTKVGKNNPSLAEKKALTAPDKSQERERKSSKRPLP